MQRIFKTLELVKYHRKDLVVAFFLGVAFVLWVYQAVRQVPDAVLTDYRYTDMWFQSDLPRVYSVMTDRFSTVHDSTGKHPLFSIISFSLTKTIKNLLRIDDIDAVKVVVVLVAFLWLASFFVFLRLMGCPRPVSVLFSMLAAVSSASLFWFIMPETFTVGSITLVVALCAAVLAQKFQLREFHYVLINILTFSCTATNWMAGILVTAVNNTLKRTLAILVYAFSIASILWIIQKYFFKASLFFFVLSNDIKYLFRPEMGGPLQIVWGFLYHSMVVPGLRTTITADEPQLWPILTTQLSIPGSGTVWGQAAVVIWTALLGFGFWALFAVKEHLKLRIILALLISGQLGMHLVYGDEMFLYSPHFIVLLIPLAALGYFTALKRTVVILACVLVPLAAINNLTQLNRAFNYLKSIEAEGGNTGLGNHL